MGLVSKVPVFSSCRRRNCLLSLNLTFPKSTVIFKNPSSSPEKPPFFIISGVYLRLNYKATQNSISARHFSLMKCGRTKRTMSFVQIGTTKWQTRQSWMVFADEGKPRQWLSKRGVCFSVLKLQKLCVYLFWNQMSLMFQWFTLF